MPVPPSPWQQARTETTGGCRGAFTHCPADWVDPHLWRGARWQGLPPAPTAGTAGLAAPSPRKRSVLRLLFIVSSQRTAGPGRAGGAEPVPAWCPAGGGRTGHGGLCTGTVELARPPPASKRRLQAQGAQALSLKPHVQLERPVPGDETLMTPRPRRAPSQLVSVSLWSQHPRHFLMA